MRLEGILLVEKQTHCDAKQFGHMPGYFLQNASCMSIFSLVERENNHEIVRTKFV
jgi:hypothetical protein